MESLFILIIAITGFLYVNLNLVSRYKFKRSTDWSAYLYVAAWGVPFFTLSWFITTLLSSFGILREIYDTVSPHFTLQNVISSTTSLEEKKNLLKIILVAIISLSTALIFGWVNRLYYFIRVKKKLEVLSKIISHNSLESLLLESYIRTFPVLVTLSSNKVYVGLVTTAPRLEDGKIDHLLLLPLLSGYRKSDNLQVKFITNYYEHYENFLDKGESKLSVHDFNITLPISEIISISLFDMETYNRFEESEKNNNKSKKKNK